MRYFLAGEHCPPAGNREPQGGVRQWRDVTSSRRTHSGPLCKHYHRPGRHADANPGIHWTHAADDIMFVDQAVAHRHGKGGPDPDPTDREIEALGLFEAGPDCTPCWLKRLQTPPT